MIPCVRFHDLAFLFRGTQDEALNQRTIFSACSGKILASCRTAIAVLFLAGISLSFDEPLRYPQGSQWVAMTYVMWTVVMLAVAWIDWWLDSRLAALAQTVDLLALAGALYVAIRPHGALNGPFLAFATFLLIAALARWGTFGVAVSSLFLILAATAPALLLSALATGPDPMHFLRGLGCIVLVSALVLWLASQQRGMRVVTLTEPAGAPGNRRSRVLSGALDEACTIMRAHGAALVVSWGDEPWIDVLVTREGIATSERLGPGLMAEALSSPVAPTMFNLPRHRRIALIGEYRLEASREAFSVPLADFLEVDEGIMAAFNSVSSQGHLLVWGVQGMAVDDLAWMAALAREIGLALDREEMASLAKNSAVTEVRNALARDLHDSVVQFLAGTMFGLEALRRRLREGTDPDGEIVAMKESLRREQGQLRVMIDRLRRGEDGDRTADLVEELRGLVDELATHWHIRVLFTSGPGSLPVSIHLAYEFRQMVREAVANAARHGHCNEVSIHLDHDGAKLIVSIIDDGVGFPEAGQPRRPRSISERVVALGGRVHITEQTGGPQRPGARLDIEVPTRAYA